MIRTAFILLISFPLLVACARDVAPLASTVPPAPALTATRTAPAPELATLSPSPAPSSTITPWPSPTVKIWPTATPVTLTPYPTFFPSEVETRVPEMPAQCPLENSDVVVDFSDDRVYDFIGRIEETFESGASIRQIAEALEAESSFTGFWSLNDFTGDGVLDLAVQENRFVKFWGCEAGSHELLGSFADSGLAGATPIEIRFVQDMNLNGVPEIVFYYPVTTGSFGVADILEWDGTQLVPLIQASHGEFPSESELARVLYWYEGMASHWSRPTMNGPGEVDNGIWMAMGRWN